MQLHILFVAMVCAALTHSGLETCNKILIVVIVKSFYAFKMAQNVVSKDVKSLYLISPTWHQIRLCGNQALTIEKKAYCCTVTHTEHFEMMAQLKGR